MIKLVILCILSLQLTACANFGRKLKAMINGKSAAQPTQQKPKSPSYSSNENYAYQGVPRRYKRMTQAKLEAENKINDEAGSLWVDEGQTSYLFAQNNQRLVGDIINVEINGTAQRQLNTKVDVIQKLIKAQRDRAARIAAAARKKPGTQSSTTSQPNAPSGAGKQDAKKEELAVKEVPSRIVETFPDGSYRIRGSKDFMIDRTEYKVIVTGIVKPADVADSRVESDKVLDGKFDIVSLRRSLKL